MSLLAFATDYADRSDYDDPELYWERCAWCDFCIDPEEQVEKHDEFVHETCLPKFCGEHCERCMEEGIELP